MTLPTFDKGHVVTASEWNDLTTTVIDKPYARFVQRTAQMVESGNAKCVFDVTVHNHSEITINDARTDITINRAGVYYVSCSGRFKGGDPGERYGSIENSAKDETYASDNTFPPTGGSACIAPGTVRRFSNGDSVVFNIYQGSGSNLETEPESFDEAIHIAVIWISD